MHRFVALDLELTPSSGQQRIIEIAGARFVDDEVVETFSTLVDPRCGLDYRIGVLTGISQEQVDSAPDLGSIAPRLLQFIGQDPIAGQSIELDLAALAAAGIELDNRAFDTYLLATLLVPALPAYDLGSIARALGLEPEREHRALTDAITTGRVFAALSGLAVDLGVETLSQLVRLAGRVRGWVPSAFLADAQRRAVREHFMRTRPADPGQTGDASAEAIAVPPRLDEASLALPQPPAPRITPLRPAEVPSEVDRAELAALMVPGGAVASAFAGFEHRPEQLRMMDGVAEAFNEGRHLLVEAGTGTGKSLAYLIPAVYFAVRNGQRVVVSTNTINLQDQLFHKDLPALSAALPARFQAALVKGRSNYLCLRRWIALSKSPDLSPEEVSLLIKSLVWLRSTESGDRAELNLTPTESETWSRVSAQAESCALSRCIHFRKGSCYVIRTRRECEGAHIIVVNHALLLSDAASGGGVLPEYSHLVVDEAHRLEEEATEQLGFKLSWGDLQTFLFTLFQTGPGQRSSGFLPELQAALTAGRAGAGADLSLFQAIASSMRAVDQALSEGRALFDTLACFLADHSDDRHRADTRLRLTRGSRTQPAWSEVEVRWTALSERLQGLQWKVHDLAVQLEALEPGRIPDLDGLLAETGWFETYLSRVVAQGTEILTSPSRNGIYWLSGGTDPRDLTIYSAPLHVGEALNEALFSKKASVVLTSATLTAEGSFDYIRERLGLDGTSELMLGSPFDYRRSTLLYAVQDIPEPAKPSYQRAVEATIADLVAAMEGRTLVLFTSHAQLRLTANAIRSRLEQEGVLVLAHGVDGSRRRLLQAFKSSPRAVLMGTRSFWEGIDVVGDALSCLVIVKLPFSVPSDPIFAARSESFDEPFRQYSVPQTILRFKQGFGRLIRSEHDRGVVVILDSRLGSKFYGPAFIHSLPGCTVKMGPAAHVVESAREWLERPPYDPSGAGHSTRPVPVAPPRGTA